MTGSRFNRSAGIHTRRQIPAGFTLKISASQNYRLLHNRESITGARISNMRTINDPIKILQKELQSWGIPFVERDCSGPDQARQIAEMMDEFCRAQLGSKLRGYLFYGSSV